MIGRHLKFSQHLTANEVHAPIAGTFVGQAHIAGTGPADKTCRECVFWQNAGKPHRYFTDRHSEAPLELHPAECTRPILNKASAKFPHHAPACRLFVENDNPPPAKTTGGKHGT